MDVCVCRLWRAKEADFPQEGEDHEAHCAATRVRRLQTQEPSAAQALQALRARRREAQEGPSAPVLSDRSPHTDSLSLSTFLSNCPLPFSQLSI